MSRRLVAIAATLACLLGACVMLVGSTGTVPASAQVLQARHCATRQDFVRVHPGMSLGEVDSALHHIGQRTWAGTNSYEMDTYPRCGYARGLTVLFHWKAGDGIAVALALAKRWAAS